MGVSTSMFRAQFLLPFSTEKPLKFLFFFSSMSHLELNSFWLSTSNNFHEMKLWSRGHNLGRFLSNSCTGLGCVWGETTTRPHIDNTEMRSMVAATHTQTQHTHICAVSDSMKTCVYTVTWLPVEGAAHRRQWSTEGIEGAVRRRGINEVAAVNRHGGGNIFRLSGSRCTEKHTKNEHVHLVFAATSQ